jgi:hypothetical protein
MLKKARGWHQEVSGISDRGTEGSLGSTPPATVSGQRSGLIVFASLASSDLRLAEVAGRKPGSFSSPGHFKEFQRNLTRALGAMLNHGWKNPRLEPSIESLTGPERLSRIRNV